MLLVIMYSKSSHGAAAGQCFLPARQWPDAPPRACKTYVGIELFNSMTRLSFDFDPDHVYLHWNRCAWLFLSGLLLSKVLGQIRMKRTAAAASRRGSLQAMHIC